MNQAIANSASAGDTAVDLAVEKFSQATEAYGTAAKEYNAAVVERKRIADARRDVLQSKLEATRERIKQFLVDAASAQSNAGVSDELRQRSLFEGLIPVWVSANAAPSLRPYFDTSMAPQSVRYCRDINVSAMDLYRQSMREHAIQDIRITPRQPANAHIDQSPRFLEDEDSIDSFFEPEVVEPVVAIVKQLHPRATVRGVSGKRNRHADYFLVVTLEVADADGHPRQCCSAVAVEFKIPYGVEKLPEFMGQAIPQQALQTSQESLAAFGQRQCDHAFRCAALPTINYGRYALSGQLCRYVRSTEAAAGLTDWEVGRHICRDFGVLSDFNRAWVVRFVSGADEHGELDDSAFGIEISDAFYVENGTPHPTFAYVYVLDQVIQDMYANPEKYLLEKAPSERQSQQASRSSRKKSTQRQKRSLSGS
ncbi:hypothetical protein IWW36_005258, partial [Coemansia brasiliensis]